MSKQPILILALALVTLVGCGPSADIPSDLEARAFLQNLVQVAQAGDMD